MTAIEKLISYIGEENLKPYNYKHFVAIGKKEIRDAFYDGQQNAIDTWVKKTGNMISPDEYLESKAS